MSDPASFDVVVIGSGPGGYVAAIRAAQLGLKTAVVERDPAGVGGTCLQRGCIPTKALLHLADVYEDCLHAKSLGLRMENVSVDFAATSDWKARVVRRLSQGIEKSLFKKNNITLFKGQAALQGARQIAVRDELGQAGQISARQIIIATGARPRHLPGFARDGVRILTSDDILDLKRVPASLIVLGAGAVGIEFASLFGRLKTQVTVVELLPRILPLEDEEISAEAAKLFARQMTIHTGTRAESIAIEGEQVVLKLAGADGARQEVRAEMVLVAVGREGVTDGLGLESTRVKTDRGYICVNERLETDEPGVFAIGDVVTFANRPHPQLAHVASHEGLWVAEVLAGKKHEAINYDRIPGAMYARPEVASVGLTEAEAKKRGHEVRIGRFNFGNLAKSRILGQEQGFVKVVCEARFGEVLGVHMLGPRATDLIGEACLALGLEATADDLAHTMHPHPTLTEALMQAAQTVYGQAIDA
ncbi:MAG: dihydrolipoyl dehydrogenase [Vicinamibacteria bacterium]|jgi:dihydrolipoamide dehydrogenase|nr:dihydrolipoyl dehydrogenase [Vicinamibacteria bacterium]